MRNAMSAMSPKTSYPAVALVLTALSLGFLFVVLMKPYIPPRPENRLAHEEGAYLRAASRQSIPWMTVDEPYLEEARRRKVPLFVVVGAPWSRAGRVSDRTAFRNPDVVWRLQRKFVCVRVDALENPEWLAAFQPLTRALAVNFDPFLQMFVFAPDGELISNILRRGPRDVLNEVTLQSALRLAEERWRRRSRGWDDIRESQRRQVAVLTQAPQTEHTNYVGQREALRGVADIEHGGFPKDGFQRVWPHVWRYLALVGDEATLYRTLNRTLEGPIVDWLDGGFFVLAEDPEWRRIEFDKLAVQNAEMAALLAQVAVASTDPLHRYVASETLRTLLDGFASGSRVSAYRMADEDGFARSYRTSFSARDLRREFGAGQFGWLVRHFGLESRKNLQMVLRLPEPSILVRDPLASRMLERLRESVRDMPPKYDGAGFMDVSALTAARAMQAGRLLGDADVVRRANEIFGGLAGLRAGIDDVLHTQPTEGVARRYLGDYLAYADACLQVYTTFDNIEALRDGHRVLLRALELYGGSRPGVLANWRPSRERTAPAEFGAPNVTDDVQESTSAMAIRLLLLYGALVDPALIVRAEDVRRQLAEATGGGGLHFSGYFSAAIQCEHGFVALCAGPEAAALARTVERRAPWGLVAPLAAGLRPDLVARGPGVYLLRGDEALGPLSSEDAAVALAAATRIPEPLP